MTAGGYHIRGWRQTNGAFAAANLLLWLYFGKTAGNPSSMMGSRLTPGMYAPAVATRATEIDPMKPLVRGFPQVSW